MMDKAWSLFLKTGNVEYFLLYKIGMHKIILDLSEDYNIEDL